MIALGVLLLGEAFTGWLVLGTLLVIVGIWLLARQHAANSVNTASATGVAAAAPGD